MPSSDDYKAQGNKAFVNKQYQKAIDLYSSAIALDKKNAVLYSNRAQCHINLKDWIRASNDIEVGLRLEPTSKIREKLLYRKGLAAKGSGNKEMAKRAFNDVLQIDANNTAAKAELEELGAKKAKLSEADVKASKSIPIEVVEELPKEFRDKLQEEAPVSIASSNTISPEVEALGKELFGHKKRVEEPEPPKPTAFVDRPTMHHLNMLKSLPPDRKHKGYQVVLDLDNGQLDEMFAYSGLDSEFLEFYLEAAAYFIGRGSDYTLDRFNQSLEYMRRFKRYDLALSLCSNDHIANLLSVAQRIGDPGYSTARSLLNQ